MNIYLKDLLSFPNVFHTLKTEPSISSIFCTLLSSFEKVTRTRSRGLGRPHGHMQQSAMCKMLELEITHQYLSLALFRDAALLPKQYSSTYMMLSPKCSVLFLQKAN